MYVSVLETRKLVDIQVLQCLHMRTLHIGDTLHLLSTYLPAGKISLETQLHSRCTAADC